MSCVSVMDVALCGHQVRVATEPGSGRNTMNNPDRRTFLYTTAGLAATTACGSFGNKQATAAHAVSESEIPFQTLTGVAALLRTRKLSSSELTAIMLKRIAALDDTWNAYATDMTESAQASAKAADQELATGKYRGPLHGVPIGVKDLCYTRGVRTMGGCSVLQDFVPKYDATVVKRLRSAGAVILGKLNLTEGAMAGYNRALEVPVNPWNAGAWPGGSSSGSGVATSAGLAFGTLGSDTGGSIRFPSAACGVVGLKPTWGRVSRYGVLALADSLDHVGPMTRSVSDAAVMLKAIAGHDTNDPTSLPDKVPDYMPTTGRLKGVRIGGDEKFITQGVDPETASAVLASIDVLADCGATIRKVTVPDLSEHVGHWNTLCQIEARLAHRKFYPKRRKEYGIWFRQFLDGGATPGTPANENVRAEDYARSHQHRLICNGKVRGVFHGIDVLACPSQPFLPFPVTPESQYGPDAVAAAGDNWGKFTVPFDYNGAPTLSLPCGFSASGLPLSLQLVGRHLDERTICQVGFCFEQKTKWHTRRPPMKSGGGS